MDHFALTRTGAPAVEPLTLAEAKDWCRVDSGDTGQDSVIDVLITAARERFEQVALRAAITQTWVYRIDQFPAWWGDVWPGDGNGLTDDDPRVLRLPRPPLLSVTGITYVDTAGATQTLATNQYTVDATGLFGRVFPAYGLTWPITRPQTPAAVAVTYTAGYGATAATVPADVKIALRQHVAHCFWNREAPDQAYLETLFLPFRAGGPFG